MIAPNFKHSCPRPAANSAKGLIKFIGECQANNLVNILDVGAGEIEYHANDMRENGLSVDTADFFPTNTYRGDYLSLPAFEKQYDGLWCAHTLEHQLNVNQFLVRVFSDVREGGMVCITVPTAKDKIVGGHVSLWNAGLLIYNLILAGFDCSDASVSTYGYNISVVVKKKTAQLPRLNYDTGDIELLSRFFPKGLNAKQNFNGIITELNW